MRFRRQILAISCRIVYSIQMEKSEIKVITYCAKIQNTGIARLEVAFWFDRAKRRCGAKVDDLHSLKYT